MRRLSLLVTCVVLAGCSAARGGDALTASASTPSSDPCPTAAAPATDYVPFVQFEGRQYLEVDTAPDEEQLAAEDLGHEVGGTRCMLQDRSVDIGRGLQDGDAAFLPSGTPLHAVAGFDVRFRLAARNGGEVLLFEVHRPPGARNGRDFLDIEGRVESITINADRGDGEDAIARITDAPEVDRLVRLVLEAPVDTDASPSDMGATRRYFLEFELTRTPAVSRVLYVEDHLLAPSIRVPDDFTAAIVEAVERA